MLAGQAKAASEGKNTYAPQLKPLTEIGGDYDPCLSCWQDEPGWFGGWLSVELQAEHHAGHRAGSRWEPIFLREVLQQVPVSANYVTVQDIVVRNYGAPLRPDFTIKVPGWQPLAIEIDGDKERWYAEAPTREANLQRDDELEELGWRVVHFTNTLITQNPEQCRKTLRRVLAELEAAGHQAKVTSPVIALQEPKSVSTSHPQTAPAGSDAPNARSLGWLKWAAATAALVALATVILGAGDFKNSEDPQAAPSSSGDCDNGHPVKGNESDSGERIYHEPTWEFYEVTRPEACFATAADAEAAGYRPSQRQ